MEPCRTTLPAFPTRSAFRRGPSTLGPRTASAPPVPADRRALGSSGRWARWDNTWLARPGGRLLGAFGPRLLASLRAPHHSHERKAHLSPGPQHPAPPHHQAQVWRGGAAGGVHLLAPLADSTRLAMRACREKEEVGTRPTSDLSPQKGSSFTPTRANEVESVAPNSKPLLRFQLLHFHFSLHLLLEGLDGYSATPDQYLQLCDVEATCHSPWSWQAPTSELLDWSMLDLAEPTSDPVQIWIWRPRTPTLLTLHGSKNGRQLISPPAKDLRTGP